MKYITQPESLFVRRDLKWMSMISNKLTNSSTKGEYSKGPFGNDMKIRHNKLDAGLDIRIGKADRDF